MKRSGFSEMSPYVYPFYTMLHPKDGFQEAKMNKKVSVSVIFALCAAYIIAELSYRLFADFDINDYYAEYVSVIRATAVLVLVFFIATASNWCFCTLLDGKGKYIDICYVVACALLPMTLMRLLTTPLSMVLTLEEYAIFQYPILLSQLWALLLLLVGLSEVHDYTAKKTILSLLLTIVGILIILFVCMILVVLFRQVYFFCATLYYEIKNY